MAQQTHRPFRFGVVAAQARDGEQWAATARQVESLGYRTLLMPDNLPGLSPFLGLASAASATTTLSVGTYVVAAPYRSAADVAWQAASLDLLSGHRFELGVGTGRPAAAGEAERLGRSFGSYADRVEQVREIIDAVAERAPGLRVLVAGTGERLLAVAAERADTVALGLPPEAGEDALEAAVERLRVLAGPRFDRIELNINLLAVGTETPPWLRQYVGVEVEDLVAAGSVSVLTGSVPEMADTLRRRRDRCGVSYVVTNAAFAAALAPVVERLTGT
jgi:probable F420-dependent oxidoreductase